MNAAAGMMIPAAAAAAGNGMAERPSPREICVLVMLVAMATFAVGLVMFALGTHRARAAPPPDADMSLAPWFGSLRQPYSGSSCCSIADCRTTDWRSDKGELQVWIGKIEFGPAAPNSWRPVPPGTELRRLDNPTGSAVVCWRPQFGVMCFVKGPET